MHLLGTLPCLEAEGKAFGSVGMDVSFGSAPLAALCNSEHRLGERWGHDRGRSVGRRLLELAAVDAPDIARLPRADVTVAPSGETVIDFGGEVVVRGIVAAGDRSPGSIRITSIEVSEEQ